MCLRIVHQRDAWRIPHGVLPPSDHGHPADSWIIAAFAGRRMV
jgi:hypothetical protein